MDDLKSLVIKCKELREKRAELEAQAKAIKAEEDELKKQIIDYMSANEMPSVHFKGLAQVVLTNKNHLEITDKNKFAESILRSLVCAYQESRPFTDGLLVQFRPNKEQVAAYLEAHNTLCVADLGLRDVTIPEISFRNPK